MRLQRRSSTPARALAPLPPNPRSAHQIWRPSSKRRLTAGTSPSRISPSSKMSTNLIGAPTEKRLGPALLDVRLTNTAPQDLARPITPYRTTPASLPLGSGHSRTNSIPAIELPRVAQIHTYGPLQSRFHRSLHFSARYTKRQKSPISPTAQMAPKHQYDGTIHTIEEDHIVRSGRGESKLFGLLPVMEQPHHSALVEPPDKVRSDGSATVSSINKQQDQTNHQSGGGTVYLDSSALGRWTSHHLEHVLSRIPSGMTGIDPRASGPRGLISPF